MTTHWIPPFTRINGRKQEASCGAWVTARDHSNEPSCPACAAYLQQDASDTRKAVDVFGEEAQR